MGTSSPRNRSSGSARRRITPQIDDRSGLCAYGVHSRDRVRHSRVGGNPVITRTPLDSRLRGNDL
jgi:hypothetical protein